jgi:hypothetical protein
LADVGGFADIACFVLNASPLHGGILDRELENPGPTGVFFWALQRLRFPDILLVK